MDLYKNASEKSFGVFRASVFGLWFLNALLTPLAILSELPFATYNPVGFPLRFLPLSVNQAMLHPVFLEAFKWALVAATLLATVGVCKRTTALTASVLMTLEQAMLRGFGHVNHAEIPLLYAAYIITAAVFFNPKKSKPHASKAGEAASLNPYQIPFILYLILFLFAYAFIGIHRVAFGGLEVFTTGRIINWIAHNTYDISYYRIGWGHWVLNSDLWTKLFLFGFPIITVFEILAPFALINPFFRTLFLLVMIPFHLMNWLFMDLLFLESILLLVLLLDISRWFETLPSVPRSVIFFDGVCGLCDRFVQWTLARDPEDVFLFAPLQGEIASETLGASENRSIVLYRARENKRYEQSGAVVRILFGLGGLYKILGVLLWVIPFPLRDFGYRFVATHRYQWFGKFDTCRLPTENQKHHFLP